MSKLSKSLIAVIFLISSGLIFNNLAKAQEISDLSTLLQILGRVEGTGTHFEINDSEYLNLKLDSSELMKLTFESMPEMITLMIEPISSATSTQITISGFASSTKYFKYQDDYHNLTEFTTDENGQYTYTQDLSAPHFIFIQPRASTKFIKDDATGGDCYLIGNWDPTTKTCTLTTDLNETIQLDDDGITFDGNGHTITGTNTGSGVHVFAKDNTTIKNFNINNFFYGIRIYSSNNNALSNNTLSNNWSPINFTFSSSNTISNNKVLNNQYGIDFGGSHISPGISNKIVNNIISGTHYHAIVIGYSDNTTIIDNIITNNGGGIKLYWSNDNQIINNFISNNYYAIDLRVDYAPTKNNIFKNNTLTSNYWYGAFIFGPGAQNNIFVNNNFVNNPTQAIVKYGTGNVFNLDAPTGGNYWSDFDTPAEGCSDLNNDGFCDSPYVFSGGQDNLPWTKQDGWKIPTNQPPTISNFNQYKSDGATLISESGITTEDIVVFKATLNDSDNDNVSLEIELRRTDEFGGSFLNTTTATSTFTASGATTTITVYGLLDGQYHWQARAVDSQNNASAWQEFGTAGNVDFEVKLVPLYTQVRSPYPSDAETSSWYNKPYGTGDYPDCLTKEPPYYSNIATCGCAITSMVMLGRYYKIATSTDNNSVDPANINSWLTNNSGYTANGSLWWNKSIEYLGYIDEITGKKMARFDFDENTDWNVLATSARIKNEFLDFAKPIVAYSEKFGHYFIIDGLLTNTYILKDSRWYNTKKLNDSENLANEVRGYDNNFNTVNLFAYLETPKEITASIHIAIASPAELLVTDPQGRKLGKDPIVNITYDEIPDSVYGEEGSIITSDIPLDPSQVHKIKEIHIPAPIDGQYDIKVIGTDSGTYALNILTYDQNGQSKDITQTGNILPNLTQEFDLNYSLETAQQTQLSRIVDIDIKPGSYPNSINCQNPKGIIPVAVLTTEIFDAATVDADTVRFGPSGAQEIHRDKNGKAKQHLEDVDKDGDIDLVLHFRFGDTGIQCGDTKTTLTGKTKEGFDITGSDSIQTVQGGNKQNIFTRFLNKLLGNIYEALFR